MSGRTLPLRLIPTIILFFLLINSRYLGAQNIQGANFLKLTIGSRAQAMGGAFTAISNDINGLYYNPAGAAFTFQPALMFYHAQWIEDISVENISFILPLHRRLRMTGGFTFLHLPKIDRYEIDPVGQSPIQDGSFQVYDMVAQVGLSYRISWAISLGVTGKFLQERLDQVSAQSFAFDLGILYRAPIDFLSIGFAVQNLGPQIQYESSKEKLPLTYRIGMAYQLPYNAVTLSVDGVKSLAEDWKIYPGIEFDFMNTFSFRTGYQISQNSAGEYTVGLGLNWRSNYSFNYVFSPYGMLGNTHRAELIFRFGSPGGSRNHSREREVISALNNSSPATTSSSINQKDESVRPPLVVRAFQKGNKIVVEWTKVGTVDIRYNLYVEIPGKNRALKINKTLLKENRFVFTPEARELKAFFYVTAVKSNTESARSAAAFVEFSQAKNKLSYQNKK